MRDRYKAPKDGLSHELAQQNPEHFGQLAIAQLATSSVLGPLIWNFTVERGAVVPDRLTVDPSTWVSGSSAKGDVKLGAQPMDSATKDRLLFHPERFTYPDEVSYRLLHESAHSFLFLTQHSASTQRLMRLASDVRNATQSTKGLTALGSLNFYEEDKKIIEDTTELMTMYAWNPSYAKEFASFLVQVGGQTARSEVGLVSISDPAPVFEIVAGAVEENLAAA